MGNKVVLLICIFFACFFHLLFLACVMHCIFVAFSFAKCIIKTTQQQIKKSKLNAHAQVHFDLSFIFPLAFSVVFFLVLLISFALCFFSFVDFILVVFSPFFGKPPTQVNYFGLDVIISRAYGRYVMMY